MYGGAPFRRVCLHAAEIVLRHPASGKDMTFQAPTDFSSDGREDLRTALIDSQATNAFRLVHGASDGWPGLYLERLGGYVLAQSERDLTEEQMRRLGEIGAPVRGVYHKILSAEVEIRPIFEMEDFLAQVAPELKERGQRLRKQMEAQKRA